MSPLSSLVLPPDSSTPTVQQHIDALEQLLYTRIPARQFVYTPNSAQQAAAAAGLKTAAFRAPDTQRTIHTAEVDGRVGAVPLTIERIAESATVRYSTAVLRQVADLFSDFRNRPPNGGLYLPSSLYSPRAPSDKPSTYGSGDELQDDLLRDLCETASILHFLDGEAWVFGRGSWLIRADAVPVTDVDFVLSRQGEWDGAVMMAEAMTDNRFRRMHTVLLGMGIFPCMEETSKGLSHYWDEAEGKLRALNSDLRIAVQINSIITTRIRRSMYQGLAHPYIPLIVTNGSLFFVVLGKIDAIDGKLYGRIGFTQIESVADVPLRALLFAHALMHRLDPVLPPPPGFSLDQALRATTLPSDVLKSHAQAQQSLLAGNRADQSDRSGKIGEKAVPQQRRAERGKKGGAEGIKLGGVSGQTRHFSAQASHWHKSDSGCIESHSQKELALPLRFNLVVAWWGEGQGRSKPRTFELATARDSQPANDHVPSVVLDKLLSKNGSLSVAKSTVLNLVFKKVWVADELAAELLNERATFDELYRQDDAANYLVGYAGFFKSTNDSHYLLVTEAGEEVEDWTEESAAVVDLVERLHRHGYVHGDLAERNIVRTPTGLRLIDLGRARRAEGDECAQEMEQLKKVLAGEADWIDYSFLGYHTW